METVENTSPDINSKRNIVYGLIDPRDGTLRYIGMSTVGLKRIKCHQQWSRLKNIKTRTSSWIKNLKNKGLSLSYCILEETENPKELADLEKFWIANIRACGAILYNHCDGGQHVALGVVKSKETIEKIRKANSGRKASEETKRKMSISRKGRKFTKKHIASLKKARELSGQIVSRAHIEKMWHKNRCPVKLIYLNKVVESVKMAALELNTGTSFLIKRLKGHLKWKNGIPLAEYVDKESA